MFLGVPLDLRNTENLSAAINTFGKFHHWISDGPYLVRSIVFASFPEDILVPRDVVFSDYAAWGGARVSWTAPLFILGANFAEQMPQDEDPMPLNGNPHPMPGNLVLDENFFALPPFPALGWNDVPLPPSPPPMDDQNVGGGWGWPAMDDFEVQQEQVAVQDQESMVVNEQVFSDSADQSVTQEDGHGENNDLQQLEVQDVQVQEVSHIDDNALAIVPYQQPVLQQADIIVGMAKVVYGPPLPPELAWKRTFETLLAHCSVSEVPRGVSLQSVEPIVLPKRSWAIAFDDVAWVSKIVPLEVADVAAPTPTPRPVAHALFPASSSKDSCVHTTMNSIQVTSEIPEESFSFLAQCGKKAAKRKVAPVVDSSLHRCTRGSVRRDGYKPVLHALPMTEPCKKKPKAKPIAAPQTTCEDGTAEGTSSAARVPPPMPITDIQMIGADLGIPPEKLTADLLMADPDDVNAQSSHD